MTVSSMLCLWMQKKSRINGWDGFFASLPEPERSIIRFLSLIQTFPTLWTWLLLSLLRQRQYLDCVPLPNSREAHGEPAPMSERSELRRRDPARLYIGCLPLPWHVRQLRREGVKGIVNMCEEWNGWTQLYQSLGVEQCHLPTIDYCNVPAHHIRRGVDFIHRKISQGESVYVHCKSGVGRCAMVLVAYLARHHMHMDVERANVWARAHRRQIISNVAARPGVIEYLASVSSDGGPTEERALQALS